MKSEDKVITMILIVQKDCFFRCAIVPQDPSTEFTKSRQSLCSKQKGKMSFPSIAESKEIVV